jgi:VanZ family protein
MYSRGWLAAACGVSAALVLGAPFIGQLRGVVRDAIGGSRFVTVMAAIVLGAAGVAIVFAVTRIRERRRERYAALVASLVIAVSYAIASSTGNAEVDAVERFHFIEYGVITILFYKTWRQAEDGSLLVMPVLAGFIVGTLEEWLQWFIPARIGEARDVLLNSFAIGCGLLFSLALDPPTRRTWTLTRESRRRVTRLAAVALLVFGGFVHSVHLGFEIKDADAGIFRSRYTNGELADIAAARARQWAANPPLTWSRLSREDQYFSEGLAHVQRRNELWQEGNVMGARQENLILEKYYAPVLDAPSYVSATGHRWPPDQRVHAEASVGPGFMIFDSDALPYPVVTWPKWLFWSGITAAILIVLRRARSSA